jgi:hypothetical protein
LSRKKDNHNFLKTSRKWVLEKKCALQLSAAAEKATPAK